MQTWMSMSNKNKEEEMSKAVAIFITMFTLVLFVAAPIAVSYADQAAAMTDVKKDESTGVWGWIKDKAGWVKDKTVWVGTEIKDGVVYVGSAIGTGFKKVWHWVWPWSKDEKKPDVMPSTGPTAKM